MKRNVLTLLSNKSQYSDIVLGFLYITFTEKLNTSHNKFYLKQTINKKKILTNSLQKH